MIWLTKQQICNASVTSLQAAAYCSMIHWNQVLEAGAKGYAEGDVSMTADHCAICQRMRYKKIACPLNKNCNNVLASKFPCLVCCQEYYDVIYAARCYLKKNDKITDEWNAFTIEKIKLLIERIRHALQGM